MIERRNGYRICQWDVRDLSDDSAEVVGVPYPRPRPTNIRDASRRKSSSGQEEKEGVRVEWGQTSVELYEPQELQRTTRG